MVESGLGDFDKDYVSPEIFEKKIINLEHAVQFTAEQLNVRTLQIKPKYSVYCGQQGMLVDLCRFKDINHPEEDRYFYHPDHLGSSLWITDAGGKPIQHLAYLPFGEEFVDQRTSDWSAAFKFSGKEKDEETGYNYFGARYYMSELGIWGSVDPLSDMYPSFSGYNYCANNPLRYIDPDGRKIGDVDEASAAKIEALTNKNSADYSKAFARKYRQLEKLDQVYNFYEALESEIKTNRQGAVMKSKDGKSIDIISSSVDGVRTGEKAGYSKQYAILFEEIYHAADYDKGRLDLNNPTCTDEARAWKFATKAPGTIFTHNIKVDGIEIADYTAAHTIKTNSTNKVADWFKNGKKSWVDEFHSEHHMINKSFKPLEGLYNHLPLK